MNLIAHSAAMATVAAIIPTYDWSLLPTLPYESPSQMHSKRQDSWASPKYMQIACVFVVVRQTDTSIVSVWDIVLRLSRAAE